MALNCTFLYTNTSYLPYLSKRKRCKRWRTCKGKIWSPPHHGACAVGDAREGDRGEDEALVLQQGLHITTRGDYVVFITSVANPDVYSGPDPNFSHPGSLIRIKEF